MPLNVQIHLVQQIQNTAAQTTLTNAFQTVVVSELPIHINFTVSILAAGLEKDTDASVGLRVIEASKPEKPILTQAPQKFKAKSLGDGNNVFFHFDLANMAFEREGDYEIQAMIDDKVFTKTFNVKKK